MLYTRDPLQCLSRLYWHSSRFFQRGCRACHGQRSTRGRPLHNLYIMLFNISLVKSVLPSFFTSYRRGVLNKYIFGNLNQVKEQTQTWMDDYNNQRPHDALGKMAPIEYAEINALLEIPDKTKNQN